MQLELDLQLTEDVADRLTDVVYYSLDQHLYDNALFYAERLVAEKPDDEQYIHLLARCYCALGRKQVAYTLLRGRQTHYCRYLFAWCAVQLNRLVDAEIVLRDLLQDHYGVDVLAQHRSSGADQRDRAQLGRHARKAYSTSMSGAPLSRDIATSQLRYYATRQRCQQTDRAATFTLLATVYRRMGQLDKAKELAECALRLNPFLWSAFETVCYAGDGDNHWTADLHEYEPGGSRSAEPSSEDVCREQRDIESYFSAVNLHSSFQITPDTHDDGVLRETIQVARPRADAPPTDSAAQMDSGITGTLKRTTAVKAAGVDSETTSSHSRRGAMEQRTQHQSATEHIILPTITARSTNKRSFVERGDGSDTHRESHKAARLQRDPMSSTPTPRRTVLPGDYADSHVHASSPARNLATEAVGDSENTIPTAGAQHMASSIDRSIDTSTFDPDVTISTAASYPRAMAAFENIASLLTTFAVAHWHLTHYRCTQAIETLKQLPSSQLTSGWALALIARAYFEMGDFTSADAHFVQLRQREPFRVSGLEHYSALLWYRRQHVQSAALTHELMDVARETPQAWCALGNTHSMMKRHDDALKCFSRAAKLSPHIAYPHTLSGHEYTYKTNWEEAQQCYRTAIRLDQRHYNAWWGLGQVYLHMNRPQIAIQHLLRAMAINPTNPAIRCSLGLAYNAMGRNDSALQVFKATLQLAPQFTMAHFRYAKALAEAEQYEEALEVLETLQQLAPSEANVHLTFAQVYQHMRRRDDAMRHLTWAIDLAGDRHPAIRDMVNRLESTEDTVHNITLATVGDSDEEFHDAI